MIIFDLDGTLADCQHRRHFVEKNIACDHWHRIPNHPVDMCDNCKKKHREWKPDWQAFYEACDQDTPIEPTLRLLTLISTHDSPVEIWSGRCESVREKTIEWFYNNWFLMAFDKPLKAWLDQILKMRPIGDNTPDDQLKERWLDEIPIADRNIEFVFDDSETCCNMWNKRGIMCFLIKDAHGYSKNKSTS